MNYKQQNLLRLALYGVLAAAGVWLFGRYIIVWSAPFVVAFLLAVLMEPAVRLLIRGRWPRALAAGLCTAALTALLAASAVWLVGRAGDAASWLTARMPELIENIVASVQALQNRLLLSAAGVDGASQYMEFVMDSLTRQLSGLPGQLSGKLLELMTAAAAKTPSALLFAVTSGIGAYFLSASYPAIREFIAAQLPEHGLSKVRDVCRDLRTALKSWLKAQGILAGITFVELLTAFLFLRVRGALWLAAVTAVVDALPVFGAGTVLIPWLLYAFAMGDYPLGTGLLITYAGAALLRRCFEAKLVGDQLGLHPIVTLLAIYIGYRVWGVLGMLVFPILAILLKQLNDRGVIHLWKNTKPS